MNTERYLISSGGGPKIDPIRRALEFVAELHEKNSDTRPVTLVTPSNISLAPGNALTQVVGGAAARALLKNQIVPVLPNLRVRYATQRTLSTYAPYGTILAIYPTRDTLDQIDSVITEIAIVVVPWNKETVEEWVATWGPTVLGGPTTTPRRMITNPFVEVALEGLTSAVNLSTGLGHPLDRAQAVTLFRTLDKLGEPYDPDEIRAWAVRHNWSPKAAEELKSLAVAIRDGKRVRSQHARDWSPAYIELLRSKVEERESG